MYEYSGMTTFYKGDDVEIVIDLKDENGPINLDDAPQIIVLIYHSVSNRVLARFAKNSDGLPSSTENIEVLSAADGQFMCRLTSEKTRAGESGIYIIERKVKITDTNFEDGTLERIVKNELFNLEDSRTAQL